MDRAVQIAGTTYESVPSVTIPTTGGGEASFVEISDTTALAADVASGKFFYTADGIKTQGTASGGGGGDISGNVADFLAFVPAFDDTWSTTEFSILSYPSSGYIEVPHSLGEVPSYAVVLKTDITLSDMEGIIGGYNFISGAKTDSALNRNLRFINNSSAGTNYNQLAPVYGMGLGTIQNNNWNMVGSVCPDWTSEKITFRTHNNKSVTAGYCLGQYILGVKKV